VDGRRGLEKAWPARRRLVFVLMVQTFSPVRSPRCGAFFCAPPGRLGVEGQTACRPSFWRNQEVGTGFLRPMSRVGMSPRRAES
jgi:hypothetical protein